uniref:Peripheral subunit-binding (PSBD) domain-containing protein n=1 Tax=Trichuris muris TaxID=70415 RepID=A0A5S6QQ47_TRIMR
MVLNFLLILVDLFTVGNFSRISGSRMLGINAAVGYRLRLALCLSRSRLNHSTSSLPIQGLVGPAVRFLLLEYQIDASKVPATGPRNALLKQDVLDYITAHGIKKPPLAPALTGAEASIARITGSKRRSRSFVDVQLPSADLISKTAVPHGYLSTHANVTEIVNEMKKFATVGCELSFTSVVIRACVLALKTVPELNALSDGSRISLAAAVNVAVYVPSQGRSRAFGVLRGAEKMTMKEIEMNRQKIEQHIADGTLSSDNLEGGTFSVCNLSDLNVSDSAELVRPPQVATLSVGRLHQFVSGEQCQTDRVKATLSFNNAVVSEELASKFLEKFRFLMEHPLLLS